MTDKGMILLGLGALVLLAGLYIVVVGKDRGSATYRAFGMEFSGPVVFGIILVGALLSYFGATMQPPRDSVVKQASAPGPSNEPATTTAQKEKIDGWVYLGNQDKGRWEERFFAGTVVPKVGDTVTATSPVNLRSGPIEYSPITGWTNKAKIGVVLPGIPLTVREVKEVDDGFYWMRVQR
jgi:hypothetical protein